MMLFPRKQKETSSFEAYVGPLNQFICDYNYAFYQRSKIATLPEMVSEQFLLQHNALFIGAKEFQTNKHVANILQDEYFAGIKQRDHQFFVGPDTHIMEVFLDEYDPNRLNITVMDQQLLQSNLINIVLTHNDIPATILVPQESLDYLKK